MPYRKEQLVNDELYHVILKRAEGNLLFENINDYYRGILSIYEFNNANPTTIRDRKTHSNVPRGPSSVNPNFGDKRDKLVEVFCFCLMPNHIHLLLKQLQDNGITKFLSKIGTGLGGYYNRKYGRKGHVFQNRFASVHIKTNNQLKVVFVYIHTNPISLIEPKWKEVGIQNPEKVIKFIEHYEWSSYPDYIARKSFPLLTNREFILKTMDGSQNCKNFVENWIKYKGEIKETNLALE